MNTFDGKKLACSFDVPYELLAEFPGFKDDPILFDFENDEVYVFMADGTLFNSM